MQGYKFNGFIKAALIVVVIASVLIATGLSLVEIMGNMSFSTTSFVWFAVGTYAALGGCGLLIISLILIGIGLVVDKCSQKKQ